MHSFTSVMVLGLDSFLACIVIGSRSLLWPERARLAIAFGVWDAMATLLGSFWPHQPLAFPALALWAAFSFLLCRIAPPNRSLLYVVPALLSLDNFFGGSPASTAPGMGISSALMALCGLCLGAICRRAFLALTAEA